MGADFVANDVERLEKAINNLRGDMDRRHEKLWEAMDEHRKEARQVNKETNATLGEINKTLARMDGQALPDRVKKLEDKARTAELERQGLALKIGGLILAGSAACTAAYQWVVSHLSRIGN